jgi:hypothetical protein
METKTKDDGARLVFRLSCIRCRHDSIVVFDDAESYHRANRVGCPGCMGTETYADGSDKARRFPDGFEVVDRTITDAAWVQQVAGDFGDDFDALPQAVTDTQEADFFAVEVDGTSTGRRASTRDVARGTVCASVRRARNAIRSGDAYTDG